MLCLLIIWIIVIFSFSSQSGTTSGNISGKLAKEVNSVIIDDYEYKTEIEKEVIDSKTNYLIRKTAHFSEYAILGLLLYLTLSFIKNRFILYGLSLFGGILNAIIDEYHQTFISGRSGAIKDVIIDSLGVLTMLLVIFAITLIKNKLIKNKEV